MPALFRVSKETFMPKIEHARQTFGYYFLLIIIGLDAATIGPTLPSLAAQTGSTLAAISAIFIAGPIGYTLGTMGGGWVFDRFPGHVALAVAEFGVAAMLALMPFAPSLEVLLVILLVKGVANGFINTGANTLLMWMHGEKSAPYMNALHFFFGLGAFMSPILVAQLLSAGGTYHQGFWILASLGLLAGIYLATLPVGPRPPEHIAPANGARTPLHPYLPVLIAAMLFLFFYVGAELTFGGWVYTYAVTLGLASTVTGAYLNAGFWLSFTVGRLVSVAAATRFSPQQVIPGALVAGLALAAPGSTAILWLVVIGLGFFMAPIFANGLTLAGQSVPLTAQLTSIILLGDSVGGMALPWLTGQVIERLGAQSMTWLVFASLALNLAAYFALLRLRKRRLDLV